MLASYAGVGMNFQFQELEGTYPTPGVSVPVLNSLATVGTTSVF